jgi:serine/threonine protein kinase
MGTKMSCDACAGNGQHPAAKAAIGGVRTTAKAPAPPLMLSPTIKSIEEDDLVEIVDDKDLDNTLKNTPQRKLVRGRSGSHPDSPSDQKRRINQIGSSLSSSPKKQPVSHENRSRLLGVASDEKQKRRGLGARTPSMPELGKQTRPGLPSKRERRKWGRSQSVQLTEILQKEEGSALAGLVGKIDCNVIPADTNPMPVLKLLAGAIRKMEECEPGRWAVSKLVGIQSANSIVVVASDQTLGEVGIKIMGTANSVEPFSADVKAKLERSAKTAKRVRHSNCCQTLEWHFSADSTIFWLVREYYEGDIFRQIISQRILAENAAIQAGIQILQGLEVVHAHGIAHQFISPRKIICTRQKDKLHYGLVGFEDAQLQEAHEGESAARQSISDAGSWGLAQTSHQAGSTATALADLAYMSPEQRVAGDIHCESDLWAVAVILFEAVTGCLPYPSDCEEVLPQEGARGDEPQMRDVRELAKAKGNILSDTFVAFLERALRRKRADRFCDAVQMEQELREVPTRERKKRYHVFVSYRVWCDKEHAKKLTESLKQEYVGIVTPESCAVFLDQEQLKG